MSEQMDDLAKYIDLLGEEVTVTIDRPLGSTHPELRFSYEANYGYVPGTRAGDGHEIDAWVLGVDRPLESYKGVCVAIIMRYNDNEHKLVVSEAPLSRSEIRAQTGFVEAHYESEIILLEGHEEG
ncbi:MAG: inorganic pyrophosphatase [Pseudomonadales bacterium]|nr:inorganic pyrophosphatase [Pseudomonadales bacterium]